MSDITKWDHWASDVDANEELAVNEKVKVKSAFDAIRRIFGDDFEASVVRSGHPIYYMISNRAGWTRRWLISLADAMEAASRQKNGEKILAKLKTSDGYHEAVLQLDVAKCFIDVGFTVEFLKEDLTKKTPDLLITNPATGEEIYVEVTEMGSSVQEKETSETFDQISEKLFFGSIPSGHERLYYKGTIYKHVAKPHLDNILKRIDTAMEKVLQTGLEEVIEEGVIVLGIAKDKEKLDGWAHEKDVDPGSSLSMPLEFPDMAYRLGTKIKDKYPQFVAGKPNVLCIRSNGLFFHSRDMQRVANKVEEYVYGKDNLVFCVLLGGYVGGSGESMVATRNDHYLIIKALDLRTKESLIFSNKFVKQGIISQESSAKIVDAFIKGDSLLY